MKLGISGQGLGEVKPFSEIVRIGKKYDIDDFEIWPCNAGVDWDYGKADLSSLKKLVKEENIRIFCVTQGGGFLPEAVEDPAVYARGLIHTINAAVELGATVVNHYCARISSAEMPDFYLLEQYWAEPLKYAERVGVTLALENEAHDSTSTPQKMQRIIEHFNSPFFRTNFDAVNYFHASTEGFPGAYEVLKPYIAYVHLKNACLFDPESNQPDFNRGTPMSGLYTGRPIQYAPIPHGAVNIPGLITRLAEDGVYQGVCTLEPHTTPDHVEEFYAAESQWLRKLGFFR